MGTWGDGLFDSDSALDRIGDVTNQSEAKIAELAQSRPTRTRAEQLAAHIGLLLQLSPYSFESAFAETIARALEAQGSALARLKPAARRLLERIAGGEGAALAGRTGAREGDLRQALGGYLDGVREDALFDAPAGRKVVQALGTECLKSLRGGLRGGDLEDLHRAGALAMLGLLLLIEPPEVPGADLRKGLERLEGLWARQREAGDTEFWDRLASNARLAFELAILRFGTAAERRAIQAARGARRAAAEAAERAAARAARESSDAEARAMEVAEALRRGREGATAEERIALRREIRDHARARALLARLAGVLLGREPRLEKTSSVPGRWGSYVDEYRDAALDVVLREEEQRGNPAEGGCHLRFEIVAAGVTIRVGDAGWDARLRTIDLRVQPCDEATAGALRAAGAAFLEETKPAGRGKARKRRRS